MNDYKLCTSDSFSLLKSNKVGEGSSNNTKSLQDFPESSKYFLCPQDLSCGDTKYDSYLNSATIISKTNLIPVGGFCIIEVQNQANETSQVKFLDLKMSSIKATAYKIKDSDTYEYLGLISANNTEQGFKTSQSESLWIILEGQDETKGTTFEAQILSVQSSKDNEERLEGTPSSKGFTIMFIITGVIMGIMLLC